MLLEKLKLIEFETGAVNRIVLGAVEIVAEKMEEESRNMTAAEADEFKMLSTMAEAAEAPTTIETRERVLNILEETCKNLDTAVGELNLIESEAGATMATKGLTEGGGGEWGDLVIKFAVAEVAKGNSKNSEKI